LLSRRWSGVQLFLDGGLKSLGELPHKPFIEGIAVAVVRHQTEFEALVQRDEEPMVRISAETVNVGRAILAALYRVKAVVPNEADRNVDCVRLLSAHGRVLSAPEE
jgi:hypothetical protein